MDLKLKRLLEQAQFTKFKGRGYDAAEVDDFLDRATAMAAKVEVQLTEALGRSGSTPASGEAPESAGPSPEEIEAEIDRRVEARVAELPPPPAPAAAAAPVDDAAANRAAEDAAEEARRTLLLAQRTADAAMREAREEAEQLVSQAREQAASSAAEAETTSQQLRADADAHAQKVRAEVDAHAQKVRADAEADARRDRDDARDRLAAEVREMEQARESLRSDVHALEHHVEMQRSKVGQAIGELQRVLDDPDGIRLTRAPDADAPVPAIVHEEPSSPSVESDDGAADEAEATEANNRDDVVAESESESEPTPESSSFQARPPAPRRGTSPAPADPVAIAEVDHEAPGSDASVSMPDASGSLTSPVDAVDLDLPAVEADPSASDPSSTDDAFLAELRKAMADDEPLGPRDTEASEPTELFGEDRPRRFGRRR